MPHFFLGCAGVFLFSILAAPGVAASILHVDADAAGAATGQSWADAYTDVQLALAAAEPGDEIWVAAGTYKPTDGTDRSISFVMRAGVALYGGFAGSETARDQRDWADNPTILSGEIGTSSSADNSRHVIIGANEATLDGFTVTGGFAISEDQSTGHGGGLANISASPVIANCIFVRNWANEGGGAISNTSGSSPTITNCTFRNNTAGLSGGAIHCFASFPLISNCDFTGNQAAYGGAMGSSHGRPKITGCSFTDNRATAGGGINLDKGEIINCVFTGNSAFEFSGAIEITGESLVRFCTFAANSGSIGGGAINTSSSARAIITECSFSGNSGNYGGGISNNRGSLVVSRCTFTGNTAEFGGGMWNSGESLSNADSTTVTKSVFIGNSATFGGGVNGGSFAFFLDCVFTGNSARTGGGARFYGWPAVTNCTFVNNTADLTGGGVALQEIGYLTFTNSIFWSNIAPTGADFFSNTQRQTFRSCILPGSGGSGAGWNGALGADGGGNIDAAPTLLAPTDPIGPDGRWFTGDDGLRPLPGSLSIDAGTTVGATPEDILRLPRDPRPDIGAYEFAEWRNAVTRWQLYR